MIIITVVVNIMNFIINAITVLIVTYDSQYVNQLIEYSLQTNNHS